MIQKCPILRAILLRTGFVALGLISLSICLVQLHATDTLQHVQIDTGAISGVPGSIPAVMSFKGIPFAAPPVGGLRWKPPVAPAKWTGVLNADHFGSSCIQMPPVDVAQSGNTRMDEFMVPGKTSEDCLYLNVWTPAKSATDKLAVMVWIYGGGFNIGSAAVPVFDGEALAAKNVVVVTINHRNGLLGFMALPELDKESPHGVSGNYGMLDQIAALQWVARNIAAFGGDPSRVTLFGQSSGGGSVHFLSISPLARGLYRRGIVESSTALSNDPRMDTLPLAHKTLKDAERDCQEYLKKVGLEPLSLQKLRAMSTEQLRALPPTPFPPAFFTPVIDGWVFPTNFFDAYVQGKQMDLDILAGSNAGENSAVPHPKVTVAEYQAWARQKFGNMADEFLKLYPASTSEEASAAKNQAAWDYTRSSEFLWAGTRQRKGFSTYLYMWNHAYPGPDKDRRGAFHTSEVPYVFNSLSKADRPFTAEDRAIADMMSSYWANFATTGNPNGKNLPAWPAYDPNSKVMMQVGDDTKPIPISNEAGFEFFKRFWSDKAGR